MEVIVSEHAGNSQKALVACRKMSKHIPSAR